MCRTESGRSQAGKSALRSVCGLMYHCGLIHAKISASIRRTCRECQCHLFSACQNVLLLRLAEWANVLCSCIQFGWMRLSSYLRPRFGTSPLGRGTWLNFDIMLIQKDGGFRPCDVLATPMLLPEWCRKGAKSCLASIREER